MATLKEKIEQEGFKLETERSTYGTAPNCFFEGANLAIKAVIEMLEDRVYILGEIGKCDEQDECIELINRFKSEA